MKSPREARDVGARALVFAALAMGATRYEVRVTAHGPWAREGPYTLTVRRVPR